MSSIRKGIIQVIEDEGFRNGLIQAGLENVRRFEPEVVAERYLKVYEWVGEG